MYLLAEMRFFAFGDLQPLRFHMYRSIGGILLLATPPRDRKAEKKLSFFFINLM
jgi:hypothetical protein